MQKPAVPVVVSKRETVPVIDQSPVGTPGRVMVSLNVPLDAIPVTGTLPVMAVDVPPPVALRSKL